MAGPLETARLRGSAGPVAVAGLVVFVLSLVLSGVSTLLLNRSAAGLTVPLIWLTDLLGRLLAILDVAAAALFAAAVAVCLDDWIRSRSEARLDRDLRHQFNLIDVDERPTSIPPTSDSPPLAHWIRRRWRWVTLLAAAGCLIGGWALGFVSVLTFSPERMGNPVVFSLISAVLPTLGGLGRHLGRLICLTGFELAALVLLVVIVLRTQGRLDARRVDRSAR